MKYQILERDTPIKSGDLDIRDEESDFFLFGNNIVIYFTRDGKIIVDPKDENEQVDGLSNWQCVRKVMS